MVPSFRCALASLLLLAAGCAADPIDESADGQDALSFGGSLLSTVEEGHYLSADGSSAIRIADDTGTVRVFLALDGAGLGGVLTGDVRDRSTVRVLSQEAGVDITLVRTGPFQIRVTGRYERVGGARVAVDGLFGARRDVYRGTYQGEDGPERIVVSASDERGLTFAIDREGRPLFVGTVPWFNAFATDAFTVAGGCRGSVVFRRDPETGRRLAFVAYKDEPKGCR